MSYVSAFIEDDEIVLIERINGERIIRTDDIEYVFYTLDQYGDHETIFGESCTKHVFKTRKEFYAAMRQYPEKSIYEHDINPIFRYLSKNYDFDSVPDLNVAFYDIEVAFHEDTRYSTPDKAENEVISVAVHQAWGGRTYFVALPPPTMTMEQCEEICRRIGKKYNVTCLMVKTEAELLNVFFELIEDSDVISGWNSEAYDFKYLYNRICKVLGKRHTHRLCIGGKEPISKEVFNDKIKQHEQVYVPVGRVHLDYLNLYKKYTYSELSTYKLDNVAYIELDERKVEYSGTLDDLYKKDFDKFVEYNIQDTLLVKRIDDKNKFIELTNLLAHNNGVLLETTLGTVAITEQAILNQGHYYSEKPLVFPSKEARDDAESGAAGAYVSPPKVGIRKLVAGNDINSLYPSTIRALNMSPETLVAHINSDETDAHIIEQVESGKAESFAEAWQPFFNTFEFDYVYSGSDKEVTMEFNRSDEKITAPAYKIRELIYNDDQLAITANGTVFSRQKKGIIPALLERWYSERKQMQAEAAKWEEIESEETDPVKKAEAKKKFMFWDKRQMAKKINLNALYGALLNPHCRFYDKRIGQSTTLTGRSITRHMSSHINKQICGVYDHCGDAIIYGDTDSVTADTLIDTDHGTMTVEELFCMCSLKWNNASKEYASDHRVKVLAYDPKTDNARYKAFNYVYRHKTEKTLWRVTSADGVTIEVTEDHSVMVERNGVLCEVKPSNLVKSDILIKVSSDQTGTTKGVERVRIRDVVCLGDVHDYVYDVGIDEDTPFFFGNGLLVHNSSYFSVYEAYKASGDPEKSAMADAMMEDRDLAIEIYDSISKKTNESFPAFMNERFNTGLENGSIIKAGRENLASYSLFIKKKRYAMNLFEKDGIRQDKDGKTGKLKVMGIEIKRSDTPKMIQDSLKGGLTKLLNGASEREVEQYFVQEKEKLATTEPWRLGRPCGANAVSHYTDLHYKYVKGQCDEKPRIPGAIMGAIAWNELLEIYKEDHIPPIGNSSKVVNCKLKQNDFGYNSISYLTDQTHFPDWFKELPFDADAMLAKIFYKKVENIFGVIDLDINVIRKGRRFSKIFIEEDDDD